MKAFTLIELLVVIALIGVISTLAVLQFDAYRRSANDANAVAQLHDANTSMEAYLAEKKTVTSCSLMINARGVTNTYSSSCTQSEMLPGFVNDLGVATYINFTPALGGAQEFWVMTSHCKGGITSTYINNFSRHQSQNVIKNESGGFIGTFLFSHTLNGSSCP